MKFTCELCQEEHDIENLAFGAEKPDPWFALSEEEQLASEISLDQCVIRLAHQTDYFVRACLEVPIIGRESNFSWGVWVSLSQKSYDEFAETLDDPDRVELGPYFGWLCTALPFYPETRGMKTLVHQCDVGLRPLVQLQATDHPLAVHQHKGMPLAELQRIVRELIHH